MTHPLSRKLCRPKAKQRFTVGADEYELAGKLGDGAVGVVRKAIRTRDQSIRAIKFLAPDPKYIEESAFDDVAVRFKREGERGSNLDFPSLIRVYSYVANKDGCCFNECSPKNPFVLMEFVPGKTLESYIRKLPNNDPGSFVVTEEKLEIALQLIEGLEYLLTFRTPRRGLTLTKQGQPGILGGIGNVPSRPRRARHGCLDAIRYADGGCVARHG